MEITALTGLIQKINKLIDSEKYNHISIAEVHEAIASKRLLQFLKESCGKDIDLSIYLESKTFGTFENLYEEKINQIFSAYAGEEKRKWGVEKIGLCLVLAWTNEIIQLGEGLERA